MTNAEKERILAKTLEKIETIENTKRTTDMKRKTMSENEKKNRIVKFRLGKGGKVLAASLAAVMIIGGSTYAAIQLVPSLQHYFNISTPEQEKIAKDIAVSEDVKATCNGITTKITQLVGDKNGFFAEMTIHGLNRFVDHVTFDDIEFGIKGVSPEDLTYSIDSRTGGYNSDSDTLRVLWNVSYDKVNDQNFNINGKDITLTFRDMVSRADSSLDAIPLQTGTWKLNWKMNYKDHTFTKDVNKEVEFMKSKLSWDSVSISPISVCCNFRVIEQGPEHASDISPDYIDTSRVSVTMLNGMRYDSRFSDTTDIYWNDRFVLFFNEIVDVNQIESITFNNQTIILHENPNKEALSHFTNELGKFTLDLPESLAKYLTVEEEKDVENEWVGCKEDIINFTANKDGLKKTLFSIHCLKTEDIDKIGTEDGDESLILFQQTNAVQYALSYCELNSEEEIATFADIMNTYARNILPGFELILK